MPQIVDVVGYGPVEFPDGMSKAEMEKALKLLPPKPTEQRPAAEAPAAAPAQPQPAPSGPQRNVFASRQTQYDPMTGVPLGLELPTQIGAATLAGAKGMLDPFAGLAQFFGFNAPAKKLQEVGQVAKEIGGAPATGAEFVGQVASPLPVKGGAAAEKLVGALPGAGKSVVARMGAQGAVQGALMPTVEPELDYGEMLSEKLKQAGTGAAFGAAAGKATQMALAPQVSEKMQMLKDMGMKYFTPGQLMADIPVVGRGVRATEQALTSLPITGTMIRSGLETSAKDFNKAVANRILEPMGESVPKGVKPGEELISYVNQKITDAYDNITPQLSLGNIRYRDPNSASGFTTTLKVFNDKLGEVTKSLPSSTELNLANTVRQEFERLIISPLLTKKSLTGEEFREAEKSLGKIAYDYMKDPKTYRVGQALRDLQSEVRQELIYQNPKLAKELQGIHLAFRRHLPFERASGYLGAEGRVFSPAQLESGVRAETKGAGKFASGQGMLYPESQAALGVMGKAMPTSGTAERMLTAGQAGKMMGLGGTEAAAGYLAPEVLIPMATTGMLYNPLAMSLMTKLATSRPGALRQASPALEAAAARSAAISGGR